MCAPNSSGSTYLGTLLEQWTAWAEDWTFSLLVPTPGWRYSAGPGSAGDSIRVVAPAEALEPLARYRAQLHWQQIAIPRLLQQQRADVYFSPFHLTPIFPVRQPMVTTIHDLCFLQDPSLSLGALIHRMQVLSACWRARRLICVSAFTLQTLVGWRPRTACRAVLVPNGTVQHTLSVREAAGILGRAVPELGWRQYVFWIGNPTPRKNPELLFAVFAGHHRRYPHHRLALVAPRSAHPELQAQASAHGIAAAVTILDPVDTQTRDALYRGALALLFPSRCEGFGYPVVEAMAQGCPPIAQAHGPAADLVGSHLSLPTELGVEAFCEHLDRYAQMPEPAREALGAELMHRASRFSARATAEGTLEVLRSARAGALTEPA